jgi:hypothetical protein
MQSGLAAGRAIVYATDRRAKAKAVPTNRNQRNSREMKNPATAGLFVCREPVAAVGSLGDGLAKLKRSPQGGAFGHMQNFSYIITDLADRESRPIEAALGTLEEALRYGVLLARQMLADMPELMTKGMCVAIRDGQGETVSILPFDSVN